jgi:hypothetical protein
MLCRLQMQVVEVPILGFLIDGAHYYALISVE